MSFWYFWEYLTFWCLYIELEFLVRFRHVLALFELRCVLIAFLSYLVIFCRNWSLFAHLFGFLSNFSALIVWYLFVFLLFLPFSFYPLQSLWIMFICFGDIFHFFIQMLCTIRPSRKSCDIVRNFAEWWRSSWKVNCAARKNGMQEPRSSFKTLFSRTMAIPNWFSYILMSFLETPFVPLINGFHKNLTRIMHKNLLSKIFQWFFTFDTRKNRRFFKPFLRVVWNHFIIHHKPQNIALLMLYFSNTVCTFFNKRNFVQNNIGLL